MTKPLAHADFDRARRKTCRRIAAVLITAMADTDTSIETIATRLSLPATQVRAHLHLLVEGDSKRNSLEFISDFAFAMGCEIDWRLAPREHDPDPHLPLTETRDV